VQVLSETFGFHDIAIRDCVESNHISKLHVYEDHVFSVLHDPDIAPGAHALRGDRPVSRPELYLVTVSGPLRKIVDPAGSV